MASLRSDQPGRTRHAIQAQRVEDEAAVEVVEEGGGAEDEGVGKAEGGGAEEGAGAVDVVAGGVDVGFVDGDAEGRAGEAGEGGPEHGAVGDATQVIVDVAAYVE